MKNLLRIILIAAVALIAIAAFQYLDVPMKGESAPDFSLRSIGGSTISSTDVVGRPYIIHFWETGCHFCIEEFPALAAFAKEQAAAGLKVIAISEDGVGNEGVVRDFLQRLGIDPSFEVYMDEGGRVADSFENFMMPESILVGRDGRIVDRISGIYEWSSEEAEALAKSLVSSGGGK
jgi:thiol-disulfide isomerase/thioredoxin